MPQPRMKISEHQAPELKSLRQENEMLRRENADLRGQLFSVRVGVKAILETIATSDRGLDSEGDPQ